MPQWAGSCWYYLRFMDPQNDAAPFSRAAADYWLPVDLYVGGAEHAVLHLLYARFWHKALFDLGHVGTPEPFQRLVNQGMVLGATYFTKDRPGDTYGPAQVEPVAPGSDEFRLKTTGERVEVKWDKMSKSRGNVVNPDDVVQQYGADTMRLYEMFMGPLEHSAPWQTDGVAGCHRFLQRAYRLAFDSPADSTDASQDRLRELPPGEGSDRQRRLLHRTIAAVTDRIDRLAFNTAISAMMIFVRDIVEPGEPLHRDALAQFSLLLSPFAPHLAEEIWRALGNRKSLAHEPWPAADDALLVDATFPLVVQIQGKRRAELAIPQGVSEAEIHAIALAHPDVQRHLAGQTPRRVIYVAGKLLNIVV
jgi:leucyl-tRNA synthetase